MTKKLRAELEEMAREYKPRNKHWTAEECAVLDEFFGRVPLPLLAKKLGRTPDSVRVYANNRRRYGEA